MKRCFVGVGKNVRNRTIPVRFRTVSTTLMLKKASFREAFDENYLLSSRVVILIEFSIRQLYG